MSILSGNPAKKTFFNPIKNSGGVQRPRWKILNTNFLFQTKQLGKETDAPANSGRVKIQRIARESKIISALYFYLSSTPAQLLWIQTGTSEWILSGRLQLHIIKMRWGPTMWDKTVGKRSGRVRCSGQGAGKMVNSRPPSLPPTWTKVKFSLKVRKWGMGHKQRLVGQLVRYGRAVPSGPA